MRHRRSAASIAVATVRAGKGCVPTERFGTENDALPPLKGKLVINALAPSKTETVPVAVEGVTVAGMMTDCPTTDGLGGRAEPDGGSGLATCRFKRAHVATALKPSRRSG